MLDVGDKEAIAPTRHARRIEIKQRKMKDHEITLKNRTILPSLNLLRGMVIIKEVVKTKIKIRTRLFLLLERVNVKITLKQGTTQNRSGKP